MPIHTNAPRNAPCTWADITGMVLAHRRDLALANLVAILGTAAAVPIPLLMPLLVDEVLLNRPGALVAAIDTAFPAAWHGALLSGS
jgi:ATP-binding cassette subfamily C protein